MKCTITESVLTSFHGQVKKYKQPHAAPFSKLAALEAVRLINENLPIAYVRGGNIAARTNMQLASALLGLALGAGKLGAIHGMAFALEAVSDLLHGRCISIMLPYFTEVNIMGRFHEFIRIAEAPGENMQGLSLYDAAAESVVAVKRLLAALYLSIRLSDHGVSQEKLPDLVRYALKLYWWFEPNPRNLSEDDM